MQLKRRYWLNYWASLLPSEDTDGGETRQGQDVMTIRHTFYEAFPFDHFGERK